MVAAFLLAASLGVVVWNTSASQVPEAIGVSDAKRQAQLLDGKPLSVRGVVLEGTIIEDEGRLKEFVLADEFEQLRVYYEGSPPDNFGAKDVVVEGTIQVQDDGVPVLNATQIKVGCASKY